MSGIAAAQARVSAIQAQIAQLSPPRATPGGASFTLPGTPSNGTVGTPAATAAPGAPATPAPAASASTADPRSAGSIGDAQRLASRLPAAGQRWAQPIADAAATHGIDAGLLAALVQHESGFDPAARSHAGAIGLGQLMPGTARGLGVDPHDPIANLDGAARYLREQLDRFGSADLALAAYNAGPNRVAQAGGIPQITETRNYVQRVTTTWEQYR